MDQQTADEVSGFSNNIEHRNIYNKCIKVSILAIDLIILIY